MNYNQAKKDLYEICQYDGSGDEKQVKKILDYHNNTNLINKDLDGNGNTVLMLASQWNHIKIIKLLLSYNNIKINKQNKYGSTALHYASYYGNKDIIELLLSHSNINIKNNYGDTALHKASYNGYHKIVELLLSHPNININIKNNDGKLASDICCDNNRYKSNKPIILELFENHRKAPICQQLVEKEKKLVKDNLEKKTQGAIEELKTIHKVEIDSKTEEINILKSKYLEMKKHESDYLKLTEELRQQLRNRSLNLYSGFGLFGLMCIIFALMFAYKQRNKKKKMTSFPSATTQTSTEADKDGNRKEIQNLDGIPEGEFFPEEKESLKQQIEGLKEKIRELTNNIQEMDDMRNNDYRLQERMMRDAVMKLEEVKRSLVLKSLPLPPNQQTHVFLTHTWRKDEKGRNNHDRVKRANRSLQKRGLVTWFDEEWMSGTVRQEMTDALDVTCCLLIFITKKYEEKVNSKNEADNCYFEFNVAAHDKNLANMRIPIVMEECMLSQEGWQGRLRTEMGHRIYFDLSSDDDQESLEKQYDKIVERVVKLLTKRYPEVSFDNNL